jgi:hypothetical protein
VEESAPKKSILSVILTIILWLLSFGLGLEDIYASKELVSLFVYSRTKDLPVATNAGLTSVYFLGLACRTKDLPVATNAGLTSVYILGLAYLIFIIISTEYHSKHYGTPKSWRLFAWTFAVEIFIYLLYLIF